MNKTVRRIVSVFALSLASSASFSGTDVCELTPPELSINYGSSGGASFNVKPPKSTPYCELVGCQITQENNGTTFFLPAGTTNLQVPSIEESGLYHVQCEGFEKPKWISPLSNTVHVYPPESVSNIENRLDKWSQYGFSGKGSQTLVFDPRFGTRVLSFKGQSLKDRWRTVVTEKGSIVNVKYWTPPDEDLNILVRVETGGPVETVRYTTDSSVIPDRDSTIIVQIPRTKTWNKLTEISLDVASDIENHNSEVNLYDMTRLSIWTDNLVLAGVTITGSVDDVQIIEEPVQVQVDDVSMDNTQPNGDIDTRSGVYAFPGATGYAKNSTGGRGGKVIVVTSREDNIKKGDGEITLREALERRGDVTPGPATVVFNVSGIFDGGQKGFSLGPDSSYTTVACQTAPRPGVLITGVRFYVKGTEHLIMRHCATRFSAGETRKASESSGFRIANTGTCRHCLFDHLSVSWSDDENFAFIVGGNSKSRPHENVGITHSIVAEGAVVSKHSESGRSQVDSRKGIPADYRIGNHSMGITCSADQTGKFDGKQMNGCTITANMMMNNWQRNPQIIGTVGEVVNNFIVNPGRRAFVGYPAKGSARSEVHIKGNVVKRGLDSNNSTRGFYALGASKASYTDNEVWHMDGSVESYANKAMALKRELQSDDGDTEFNLSCVGASKPNRDNIDTRLVAESGGYTPTIPVNKTSEVGIGPRVEPVLEPKGPCKPGQKCYYRTSNPRDLSHYEVPGQHADLYDKDNDGMSDAWELSNGLNDKDPLDASEDLDNDGYTNLEEFINELAIC